MARIKKILENELVGGTQTTDIYPITSIKAIYDENNERLDNIIKRRSIVNVSTNYNDAHIAEVLTLYTAIDKVPYSDRELGFTMTFLSSEGWNTYQFIGKSISELEWGDVTKWSSVQRDIETLINDVNTLKSQIEQLNKQIEKQNAIINSLR